MAEVIINLCKISMLQATTNQKQYCLFCDAKALVITFTLISCRADDKGGDSKRGWGGAGSRNGSERFGHFGDRADRGHVDDRDRDRGKLFL